MAVFGADKGQSTHQMQKIDLSLHQLKSQDLKMSREKPNIDQGNVVDYGLPDGNALDLSTEEKRMEYVQEVSYALKSNREMFVCDDKVRLFKILSRTLADSTYESRSITLGFLYEYVPLCGPSLDKLMGIIFQKLLQNLLHPNASVKKLTLQALHMYFKHSLDVSLVLQYVTQYGVNSANSSIRDEVLMALPILIRAGFDEEHLQDLFISVVRAASKMNDTESTLAVVLCLNHVKRLMGDSFESFINSCPPMLYTVYTRILKNSSLNAVRQESVKDICKEDCGSSRRVSVTEQSTDLVPQIKVGKQAFMQTGAEIYGESEFAFGFIPLFVMEQLDNMSDWKSRSNGMDELLLIIDGIANPLVLAPHCDSFLEYLSKFVDDVNFKIILNALNVIYKVVLKTGLHIRPCLDRVVEILVSKLSDAKVIVRQVSLKLAMALMESLSPSTVLAVFFPYLRHKNARIREEITNIITSALLNFPSSDFDLRTIPVKMAPLLLDSKRRVRHAVLENFAVLAQQLGQGRLHPLVSAIDKVEIQPGGDGVLNAVQTRLARRMLPRVTSDGVVEYALSLNSFQQDDGMAADIAWVLAGSSGSGGELIRNTPNLDGSLNGSRRFFSAGKKKLPWEVEDEILTGSRKSVSSAPLRAVSCLYI